MRPCFKFTAKAGEKPAVIALDEEIGFWGTQAKDFRAALDAIEGDRLEVEINSPGGDVMAGLGMYNMLRNWSENGKQVTTRVTGVAASIASIVALAGDKRVMPKNSFVMVHSVSDMAWGTADELRAHADVIDKVQASLRDIYVDRMGVDENKATEIMAKDTWLTAEECLELGFATELSDAVTAKASFDMSKAALPEHVAAVFKAKSEQGTDLPEQPEQPEAPAEPEVPDTPLAHQIAEMANKGGLQTFAAHLALSCDSLEAAKTRITAATEISALCNLAGNAEFAAVAIKANKPVADVRAELLAKMAAEDKNISTTPTVQNSNSGTAGGISVKDVYAKRAARKSNSKGK